VAELDNYRIGVGEFACVIFRLAITHASGVLAIDDSAGRRDIIVLRRGAMVLADTATAKPAAQVRLARLMAESTRRHLMVSFDAATCAYPPGLRGSVIPLANWLRSHIEAQVDQRLADHLLKSLAGARLSVVSSAVAGMALDECDKRLLEVMATPRRLDQIWSLAKAPRFRLLAFVYFMQSVGVLEVVGVAADRSAPHRAPSMQKQAAALLLGVSCTADPQTIRRAYHKLARAVHPDLRDDAADHAAFDQQFHTLTAAYEQLL
jgi:DnaJ-domain-containing protein 1